MKIGTFDLERDILIVAEIGNNHEGNFEVAKQMVSRAAEAGAHAVKFQTIVPELLVSRDQTERIEQLRRFSLGYDQFEGLAEHASGCGVIFLSTPFDLQSVRRIEPLVPAFKIASGDNTFYPLIEEIAATGKPIILSAGLAELSEIVRARDTIFDVWQKRRITQELAILYCVTSYPTPPEEANLSAIASLRALGVTVGYSDHTMGIEAAVLSVALGARIIEKHFTLDNDYSSFRDHKLSANPADFALMVRRIGEVALLLGDGRKRVQSCEEGARALLRRSVAARMDVEAGTVLLREHLCWVRPGTGLAPGAEGEILGKALTRRVRAGELIILKDVE